MSDKHKRYATEVVVDMTKLLVTLSTAVMALSVSGAKLVYGEEDPLIAFWSAITAWIVFTLSISSGILVLGAIATSAHDQGRYDVDDKTTKLLMKAQQILFVLGFVLLVYFFSRNA